MSRCENFPCDERCFDRGVCDWDDGVVAMTRAELIANAAIWIGGVTFSLGVWIGAWMAIYGWAVQP
jgi:hypothetical protein